MRFIIDQQSVHVYCHHSLNGRRASYLIFSAGHMQICKYNDSAAFSQHLLPICTRFLYTSWECACGTLQINRQIKSNWLIKRKATVQVIHISLLCSYVLRPNNSAAVLDHFRSTLKRHLYTDKYSRCGTLYISSPFTYTVITHWMAGVQVIWFSVPVTCRYANVTILHHFLSIYCQYAQVSVYIMGVCMWYITNQQTN